MNRLQELSEELKSELGMHMMFLNCGLENEYFELLDCAENPDWRESMTDETEGVLVYKGTTYYILFKRHYD
jgi:hypothetical protein